MADDSLSGRFGGLFGRGSSKPQHADPGANAELQNAHNEVRRLTERLQKLEVERDLLKDLVDKVYAEDGPDTGGSDEVLRWQEEKAHLTVRCDTLRADKEASARSAAAAEKRAAAFEAALAESQQQIGECDARAAALQEKAAEAEAVAADRARLGRELEAAQGTVEALMSKVSQVGDEKKHNEETMAAVVEKTATASDESLRELADKTSQLHEAQQELARVKELARRLERESTQSAQSDARCAELEGRLAAAVEDAASERTAREAAEQRLAEADAAAAAHATEHAALTAAVADAQNSATEAEARAEQAEAEHRRATSRLASAEADAVDTAAVLDATRAELDAARDGLGAAAAELNTMQQALQAAVDERTAERDEARAAAGTLEQQCRDLEDGHRGRQRQQALLIKDLQQQVARAERDRTTDMALSAVDEAVSRGDSAAATLHEENLELLDRIAQTQEQLWSVQTAKKTYEEEIVRLTKDNDAKAAVIRAHFTDKAKTRHRSLFGPKASEVNEELQLALEDSMLTTLQLQQQFAAAQRELDLAQRLLDQAAAAGYDMSADAVPPPVDPFS